MATLPLSNLSLLIHSDNTDGSTDIVDSSPVGHTLTLNGDIQHKTDQYKFPPSSIYGDGSDDIGVPAHDSLDMGSGAFTIGCWYRPGSKVSLYGRVMQLGTGWGSGNFNLCDRHNSAPTKFFVQAYGESGYNLLESVTTVTAGQWYYLEVSRDASGTVYLFVNGVLEDTATGKTFDVNGSSRTAWIYSSGAGDYVQGHGEEFFVLKGACLHNSSFTPPLSPYNSTAILIKTWRVVHGDVLQRTFRVSHGIFPQVLKIFRSLCGSVPVRSKTFRVVHDQARSFIKIFRVVHQQSTFLQKVFRVVQQQKDGDLIKVIRIVHGTRAGEAVLKVFRAMHGLVADSFRSDTFDVSLRVGNQSVLSWSAATLTTDEGRFVWEAQINVHQQWDAETLLGQYDPVVYHRYGTDYHLIVVDRSLAVAIGESDYTDIWTVQLASPAYKLSAGIALPITKTWPMGTAAEAIVRELCDAKSITLVWQAPEYVLAELVADKQSPIDIVRTVCNVIGVLPQSAPSGALIVRKETPVMPDYKAVPVATFDALSIVELSEQSDDPTILYNAVQVSDSAEQGDDAGGLQHIETDRTDGGKDVQAWSEPWNKVALRVNSVAGETALSSGKLVVIDYLDNDGEPEWVQFVDGKSTAARPVYQGFSVVDFRGDDPSTITWQPDSKELVASGGGEYYVQIAYQWRYYEFAYYSNTGDSYQLVLADG